jgi:hypothetical protein
MREQWIHIVHLFVKAVELHHGIAVAVLYQFIILWLQWSVTVCDKAGTNTDIS